MPKVIFHDVEERERVRRIRFRFAEAKNAGLSQQEAVDYANSTGPLPKPAAQTPKPALPFDADKEHVRFVGMKTDTVQLAGSGAVTTEAVTEAPTPPEPTGLDPALRELIPPNYEELPWKSLLELVQKVKPGASIRSRAQATSIIAEALRA